jgi:DNA-directed RNA polymerase subunit N (RpoN/RPB10)
MLYPVVCFTCGLPLDDRAALFSVMRAKRVRKILAARGTVATQAAIDPNLNIDCVDILEALDVRNDCCRMHLVTAMIFTDYYN